MRNHNKRWDLVGVLGLVLVLGLLFTYATVTLTTAQGSTFYVATEGSDDSGDGSSTYPWATITHALDNVPDGSTVLVASGTYTGRTRLRGTFAQGVTVQASVPYQARLRNDDTVVSCFYGQGIALEGFDIAHDEDGAGALVIQIQDLIDGPEAVSRITLRNNVIHDSYNNDILKINNGAQDILVEGNIFYNQEGSDEHMDVNSVKNIIIQDNIFFNDFAGSGRVNNNDTSSFVVIKDSNGDSDGQLGSESIVVRRNVFLHWEGSDGQGFIRVGEDGTDNYEAQDVLIENNLLLGNNTTQIRSPFQLMNVYSVTIRANTVIGDLPAKEYGTRIFTYGDNPPTNNQIHLHNNIWADPTGTMGDTFNRGNDTQNLTFDNNLFWNAGNAFPTSNESIIEVTDDANRVIADPLLAAQDGLVLPRWQPAGGTFAGGSTTIREAFEQLVLSYGVPATGSPLLDAADPAFAPTEDILGTSRPVGGAPDIGAYEMPVEGFVLVAEPPSRSIAPGEMATYTVHLAPSTWSENVQLSAPAQVCEATITLTPNEIALDATAMMTVNTGASTLVLTNTWCTIPITGIGGGYTRTTQVRWIIRVTRPLYLPLVLRGWYQPTQSAPTLAGCPVLPANNIWNTPVDHLAVDANSADYVNTIGAGAYVHADFGSGEWPPGSGAPIGIPYIDVPGTQTKVPVTFDYAEESDPGPYPVPPDAPIEGGPNSDGDRHVLIVDRDACVLYELYHAYPQESGAYWTAGSGAIFDLNSNTLRPDGWTSADAAGLPILPGLVRYEEVAAGEINHALRFTAPQTRRDTVWPARHYASSLTGSQYPPMGQRFRLKANVDTSGFSQEAQVILQALKTYGMILADNGSAWYISGAPDARWDNSVLHELHQVHGSDFEAVNVSSLMVDPDSGQANP